MSNPIVGIDLGTTNSVVSILDNKKPKTILIENNKMLPSVVSLTPNGFVVGQLAKNMAILEPQKTVLSIKRKMGQDIQIQIGEKQMRPEEISALILQKIKQVVVNTFELDPKEPLRAVVTIPAYFTEGQRSATKQAAELAGFQVERIINEPTAAALSFGLSQMNDSIYAIYDLGGGTFDVSVIESDEGLIEVLATTGNNNLGGDDFDEALAHFIWEKFVENNKLQGYKKTRKEETRLLRIAEKTKIALSDQDSVNIQENFFLKKDGQTFHLEVQVTKKDFETLIQPKIQNTITLLQQAIKDADIDNEDLKGIILVGGSSRIPLVTQLIEEALDITPFLIDLPDEAVSHGATIQGAIIDKVDIDTILVDITPHSLGTAVASQEMNSILSMLGGPSPLLTSIIIPKNTPIPTRKSEKFLSMIAFQEGYNIEVSQGEEMLFSKNKKIGETFLEIKKPVEMGEIEVTFELDINGLLKVTAIETNTQEVANAVFKSSRGIKKYEDEVFKDSQIEDATIITQDEAANNLVKRANSLLNDKTIEEEDKEELRELLTAYETNQQMGSDELEESERALLDLLYFLEKEES